MEIIRDCAAAAVVRVTGCHNCPQPQEIKFLRGSNYFVLYSYNMEARYTYDELWKLLKLVIPTPLEDFTNPPGAQGSRYQTP